MAQTKNSDVKQFAFGTCAYERTSPAQSLISSETKALNIMISFDEALKLNLAIDECIRKLNRYKRNVSAGKKAALNLTIHLDLKRIAVSEGKLQ